MTKAELLVFIADVLEISECNTMILQQVHKYITEHGYKPIEIARALSFFVDVQGRTPEIKYGIGIVPHVMEDSRKYFKRLELQKAEQEKAAEKIKMVNTKQIDCKVSNANTIRRKSIDITKLF